MCRVSQCMQDASLGISLVLTHFLYLRWGGGSCSPVLVALDSPITMIKGWNLQAARHSNNSPERSDQTVYKFRLCVWPLHSIHCQPACSSIFQAFLSDPDVPYAGAEAEDDKEHAKSGDLSSYSEGQQSIKIIEGWGTDWGGHWEGFSFRKISSV